jgi:hypothetical protein
LKKATFHIHMKMAADLLISMPIAFPSVFWEVEEISI